MKSKAFQFFALVSFCLYLAGCIPPRINYDAKSFADTAADTTPQQDADPSDDALGDQSANTDAEPDTIPPHDATTDGQSLVDAPQTPEDAAVDGIDDGSPFDGALDDANAPDDASDSQGDLSCGERSSCPNGFVCADDGQGPKCICKSPTCGGCETAGGRECISGEFCSAANHCTCGDAVVPSLPATVDRCAAGSYVCGTGLTPCESGYGCSAANCVCRFPVGTTGFCWQTSDPQGWTINSVYLVSDDDVLAVANLGTILSFDGQTWSAVVAPGEPDLRDIDGAPDGTIVAVGSNGAVLLRQSGNWSGIGPAAALDFVAVRVFSKDDIFVAARDGTVMRRLNGQWAVTRLSGSDEELVDLGGTSSVHVIAVGSKNQGSSALMVRFDGGKWVEVETGIAYPLWSVSAPSTDLTFVVASDGLYKGDAQGWASEMPKIPLTVGSPRIVAAEAGGTRIWVATYGGGVYRLDLDQSGWIEGDFTPLPARVGALHVASSSVVIGGKGGFVALFTKGQWTVASPTGAKGQPDGRVRFSTTGSGTILATQGSALLEHVQNGWKTLLQLPDDVTLLGLHAATSQQVFVLATRYLNPGVGHLVFEYGGTGIPSETLLTSDSSVRPKCPVALTAIHGFGGTHVVAVGSGSTQIDIGNGTQCEAKVARYAGGKWELSSPAGITKLNVIHVFNDTTAIAAGPGIVAWLKDGVWSVDETLKPVSVNGIWAGSASSIVLVGDNGAIYYYDGFKWEAMASNTGKNLYSVWAESTSDIWVLGEGVLLRYVGTEWNLSLLAIEQNRFFDIVGLGTTDIWIGGTDHGIIHKRR